MRKKGDSALSELQRTYEMLRDQLADRLDEIDTRALGNRAYSYSKDLRQRVEDRVRPKPRRRFPLAQHRRYHDGSRHVHCLCRGVRQRQRR